MFETFSNGMRYFDARTVRKCDMYYNTSSRSLYSFSEEEGGDTADSLDIKPPQAVVRHHKSSSSRRREKHSDRRSRRDEKERKSRQHEREDRHRDKHRHRRHAGDPLERSERLESSKRNRDRMERLDRMEGHSRDSRESSRHERKERSTGDRVLEDLRERLLDKRRERREEPRDIRDYKIESRRELRLDDAREMRESRDRRDVRMEDIRDRRELRIVDDGRDRREVRVEEQRHIRMVVDEQFSENELMERPEKRRKRSHKHDRMRERDQEKMEREKEHREKQLREAMEIVADEINEMEAQNEIPMRDLKDPKEMTEQELRKERLLEADREMARRKEVSRIELEARRMKRGEKRLSPEHNPDPSIVELSDESVSLTHSEGAHSKSPESRHSSEGERSIRDRSSDRRSSDSSESSSDDDEESNESNKGSNGDSNDASDYNNPSPLSVDRLAKSDHSDGDSPGHVDSNNMSKNVEKEEKKKEEEEPELPPYLPAIQGCRSVEEFQCLNRIEEGTYGVVYRARDKRTDEIVALKRLKMEKEKEGFPITSLREINTLLKAQHPNIVTVREIVVGSNMDKIFIVMDYVEHDLKSLIETMKQKKQVFIPGEVKCLMQQLLRAVAHLHDNWILHRDLKTSNLLLSHRGILKVGDFGLAREYGSPLRYYTPIVVTLWYRAPELLLSDTEYSTPVDMWSVGCIFAELLRMEALFPGKSEADQLTKIFKELGTPSERIWPGYNKLPVIVKSPPFAHYPVNNLRQRFSLSLSELGIELLNKFLTYDPRQRVTAEDALNHEYFTEAPLPIDPQMFPTWPAKSEQGVRTTNASPKPPSGGKEYKQLGDGDDADLSNSGFHMGLTESGRAPPVGGGFHLKF
ncbi:cyclin-dependent kinase 11B isoform X2 [Odontomachus brunneus]|uniref:cyclin-dependent kinase 11B isoform X2 n=1 Tax=Odontomachus brunneus TaxID=486640 RepID=UPI0013F19BF9|nr:cyclin-dependent kinase 11B isoform X2 [Odontomachus brunneus]XP_032686303.1 cyclin-dependent kinase 11B isoform X2 [Odontomachus brunneus]